MNIILAAAMILAVFVVVTDIDMSKSKTDI